MATKVKEEIVNALQALEREKSSIKDIRTMKTVFLLWISNE